MWATLPAWPTAQFSPKPRRFHRNRVIPGKSDPLYGPGRRDSGVLRPIALRRIGRFRVDQVLTGRAQPQTAGCPVTSMPVRPGAGQDSQEPVQKVETSGPPALGQGVQQGAVPEGLVGRRSHALPPHSMGSSEAARVQAPAHQTRQSVAGSGSTGNLACGSRPNTGSSRSRSRSLPSRKRPSPSTEHRVWGGGGKRTNGSQLR